MKPRVRNIDSEGDGLDSLLDTLTNVVGILVMVLIATQLSVRDAVVRIAESDIVSAEDVEAASEKLRLTREQRDAIESQINDSDSVDVEQVTVQLTDLRRELDNTKDELDQKTRTNNRFAKRIAEQRKEAEAAKKSIKDFADSKLERERLQKEITSLLKDEATLKALLDETEPSQAPPPKIVTLPDPRPAPEGVRQVVFLCANNRVYPIAADDIRKKVRDQAEFIVKANNLYGGPKVGVDEDKFMRLFERSNRSLQDDFFKVELYASGIYPRLRFTPRESAGESPKRILNSRSKYQQALSVLDKKKYYARFIVLPDSFEAYLVARGLADRAGLLAGWSPQGKGWKYVTHLGGPLLFGPKPPPNPNPSPPGNKKPANVID